MTLYKITTQLKISEALINYIANTYAVQSVEQRDAIIFVIDFATQADVNNFKNDVMNRLVVFEQVIV